MLRKIRLGMFALLAASSLFTLGAAKEAKADHVRPHYGPYYGWNYGYRPAFYPGIYPCYRPFYAAPIYPAPFYGYRPLGMYRHW